MNMENPRAANDNEKPLDLSQALAEIGIIRQRVAAMGANDSEPSELDQLVIAVRNGKMPAAEGLARARQIEQGKMDYH